MCFHSKQSKKAVEVENRFNAKIEKLDLFAASEHINAFAYPQTPIITDEKQGIIQHYKWGLIPSWSKDTKKPKGDRNVSVFASVRNSNVSVLTL